jgi:transcriptional regulator GlxA family with amidase domain
MQIRHACKETRDITPQYWPGFFGIFVSPTVNLASSQSSWAVIPLPAMETTSGRLTRRAAATHQEAVERAEVYLRAHFDGRVPLARLCGVTGLSERGLRNAFYDVCGMSPTRYLRALRLRGARLALAEASTRTTVTAVATDYGFYELGRFARTYRAVFGEAPSDTLRGHGRRTASELPPEARGQRHVCTA